MLIRLSLLLLLVNSISAFAQTQSQTNEDACAEYQAADKKLNTIYQQVLNEHKNDVAFIQNIKKSQRAWIVFRNAQLAAIYPAADKLFEYGSVYPMCSCGERTTLVDQRIVQLSGWLSAAEGDACRGSR